MKNERTLIVDAYNVIYASDSLKHLMPKNKVRARESLAEKIKAIHSLESVRIMLVFDSSMSVLKLSILLVIGLLSSYLLRSP